MRLLRLSLLLAAASSLFAAPLPADERPLRVTDLLSFKDVADPRLSPDGRFVAYTVTTSDLKEDTSDADVYMSALDGGEPLRLTSSKKGDSRPRFSPDGEWIAFVSSREGDKAQVCLMSREGGEAVKLTDYKASVSTLAWSPDSKRLAWSSSDPTDDPDAPEEGADKDKKKTAKPIVIRRLQFMSDGDGYLKDVRSHVHVFDVAKKTSFAAHLRPLRRLEPGLVARRHADRVREQPHAAGRGPPRTRTSSWSRRARARSRTS